MNKLTNKARDAYLQGQNEPVTTDSSILVSSSKYLNNAKLRDVIAQETLRKNGWDIPITGLLPDLMLAINEANDYQQDLQAILEERKRLPEFAAFLDERFLSNLQAEDLKDCASGTLGAHVYAYMIETGMNLNFLRDEEAFADDLHYYTRRSGQCHDIEHIVTGLGPNLWGELGLVFFKGAMDTSYFSTPVASILNRQYLTAAGTYFIRTNLHYPHLIGGMMEAIKLGIEMAGRTSKQFLYIKWEDYWDVPLEEVRRELNIYGFPAPGAWDWTNAESRG
jgi:ubiquinone biosynthesis protein COQ4